ncbi:glycosyltransferase [Paenibacillus flagellatus]|nr:glycosyltransferase [Paenibacillus flagellatus]
MRKKILFVLPSLEGGGAQRVLLMLSKYFDNSKYEISLAVVHFEGSYKSQVPDNVQIYDLGVKRVRQMIIPFLKLVRRLRPDTIFSTLGYLNIALVMLRPFLSRAKLVVREGSIVSESIKRSKYSFAWPFLYKTLYKKADLIICQSRYMLEDLGHHFLIPQEKMRQIYNPIDFDTIHLQADSSDNPYQTNGKIGTNVLAIGRLNPEKGFHRLIQSLPELLKVKPDAMLWILGVGPLEQELRSLSESLGVGERVVFKGFENNPYRWLKHADLFVLPSYYEGLPNVLLEAIAVECPVLVVNHPGGTKEIMEITGMAGRIVERLEWRADWFSKPDPGSLQKLKDHFEVKKIVQQYSSVM